MKRRGYSWRTLHTDYNWLSKLIYAPCCDRLPYRWKARGPYRRKRQRQAICMMAYPFAKVWRHV